MKKGGRSRPFASAVDDLRRASDLKQRQENRWRAASLAIRPAGVAARSPQLAMVLNGLRSNARFGIENDADPAAPALRAHHAVLEVREQHLAASRPDQRLKGLCHENGGAV